MDAYFGPGGRLCHALAGFEPRAEQENLAEAVADALAGCEHLVAEAGTGTGKSLAYLLPALVSGQRVQLRGRGKQVLIEVVNTASAAE